MYKLVTYVVIRSLKYRSNINVYSGCIQAEVSCISSFAYNFIESYCRTGCKAIKLKTSLTLQYGLEIKISYISSCTSDLTIVNLENLI